MVKSSTYFVVLVSLIIGLSKSVVFAETFGEIDENAVSEKKSIVLREENFEHIKFKRIKANKYTYKNQQLEIEVDNSASFLLMPFDDVKKVKKVGFKWRSIGKPNVEDAAHEKKRNGDDAVFKIALLLKSDNAKPDDSFLNPLMPAWMKRVDKILSQPSEKMLYLVADAKHPEGQHWLNPYNDRVKMISMESSVAENGWKNASYTLKESLDVVGVWLMSDGDNTDSKFTTKVKDLIIN